MAEDITEVQVPAAAAPGAPPRPNTATETFVEQYDLDTGDDPVGEAAPSPTEATPQAASDASPPAGPTSQRDPATGRFVTAEAAIPSSPHSPSAHSPRLVRMAKDLGLDDGEIESIPAERLDEIVYHLNKQALSQARTNSIERTLAGATERNIVSQQPDPAVPAAQPTDEFDLGIDEAQYDPGLIKAIKAMGQRQEAKIKELESQLKVVNERQVQRTNETTANRIDRAFGKHAAHLGTAKGSELEEGSRDYQRRIAILTMVDRNKSKASLEAKIDQAVSALYGEPAATPKKTQASAINDELEARGREWNAGALARPTQRQPTDMPNGSRKAEKSVAAALAEIGAAGDGEPGAEDFLD